MWKRTKKSGATRENFSLVHRYIQHFNEVSGNKTAVIRKISKIPGVMITQYDVNIPEGKSWPDFQRKPVPFTAQEGKVAIFKAAVKGNPMPEVSWRRIKGNISDKDKFRAIYDASTGECRLEIHHVSVTDADTYKCTAVNEYGKAFCTTTLSVTGDGVEDLNLILKKMEERKKERLQNMCKDGLVPYDDDTTERHNLKAGDQETAFSMRHLMGSVKTVDVENINFLDPSLIHNDEEVNLLLADIKFSMVDFVVKIQETTAQEREDALFECVLTHPLSSIAWMGKGSTLEDGEKHSITVSDNKLIHRLLIKDCRLQDKGIYSAVAGVASCSAWLVVKDESDSTPVGKTKPRKTTVAGGARKDLDKVAREQQIKSQKEMERILAAVKAKNNAEQLKKQNTFATRRPGDATITGVAGNAGVHVHDWSGSAPAEVLSGHTADREETKTINGRGDGTESQLDGSCCEELSEAQVIRGPDKKKRAKSGQVDTEKVTDADGSRQCVENGDFSGSADDSRGNHSGGTDIGVDGLKEPGYDESEWDGQVDSNGQVTHPSHRKQSQRLCEGDKGQQEVTIPNGIKEKKVNQKQAADTNGAALDNDESDCYGNALHQVKQLKCGDSEQPHDGENEKYLEERSDHDETVDATASHTRRKRPVPLIEDLDFDPGVHFIRGLSDVSAIINESAELTCKLSSEECDGAWFKDGKKISSDDNFIITRDGVIHKLMIIRCEEEHSGKYRFEADGRKTEAMISVRDPPRFDPEDLRAFTEPVKVKVGHNAVFKLHFVGHEPVKIQWYREGEELQDDSSTKTEKSASHSRLLLIRCQRKETGEIKIKLKNEHGVAEAISILTVLDKPTAPQGPPEVMESSATCIEFRWRPPKDDGGSPVRNYVIERRQVGRNTWKKIGETPGTPTFRDTDVDHGRKYCYRVRAVTTEGTSDNMESDEMQAGTLAFPGPPAPPKVVSAFDDCINLCWTSPSNTGRSRILGYILEKRKKGSNLWIVVNAVDELIKDKKCAVKDVVAGMEYEFRVSAVNLSGPGECSSPSEFVFARDPKKPPGKVTGLKVTETSYTHLVLTWTTPEEKIGIQDEAKGYFVEIRHADCMEWSRCNGSPVITTSFSVKGLKSMEMYWARVIATNDGGESEPMDMANYIIAMPSPVRPRFTNNKMKSFMVVRAGNSVRITVNFEASPWPDIMWTKDNMPVTKQATISNSDGSSQMLIPSSERSDSGIYTVLVKNLVGQETFSIEVRVTDDPKPPGLVELEENVPGTVTLTWDPSPDEKRDDRLHYTVSKLDSFKQTWTTVADRLFNNKFTVCNIMHGRKYHFRVYAKNDIGISAPAESSTWGKEKKREKFVLKAAAVKDCDLRCAPSFIVPLKLHTAPKGYECYMSCAVTGNPKPRITWYRNHISLNTNDNFYISDTCGVCSMLVLHVGPKDMGEYTVSAENALGRAECSTVLSVRE